LTISNTKFNKNTSDNLGGAIYANNKTELNIKDGVSFTANKSTNGGAISSSGTANITGKVTFDTNEATTSGGAIFNNGGTLDLTLADTLFTKNTALKYGGAIANSGTLDISGSKFLDNKADASGGAIYSGNKGSNSTIKNTIFEKNYAKEDGGAVSLGSNGNLTIDNSTFSGNYTDFQAGALNVALPDYNNGDTNKLTLTNSTFTNNHSTSTGGAMGNFGESDISNVTFENNYTTNSDARGGAFFAGANSTTVMDNVTFKNNTSAGSGGAIATRHSIYDTTKAKLDILNSTFSGNTANTTGGAIDNYFQGSDKHNDSVYVYNSKFINNTATNGGAIFNHKSGETDAGSDGAIVIENADFANNTAKENGGAIFNETENLTVTDANFVNNSATDKGGAIFANGNLTVNSENKNIVFDGNSAADGGDIYMNTAGSDLNMNAADGKSITVASGISGDNYNLIVNADSANTGSIILNSTIQNAAIEVQNGTFHLAQGSALNNSTLNMATGSTLNTIDNAIASFGDNIKFADNTNVAIDVHIGNGTSDNFTNSEKSGSITITDINEIGEVPYNGISIDLAKVMGIDSSSLMISNELLSQTKTVLTPIRYLYGSVSEDGMLTYAPTGNGYKDFNPAVMASPVAAQLGGYLTQLNSYDEAFRNMDMYMLMTKKQRQALKLRNKFAAADSNLIFDPTGTPYDNNALWVRPYATFENVHLKGGPRVSNVAYGSFFGAESELYDLGHGWDGMFGVYAGYNGSHQAFNGISMYQNGGTLGLVGMAYKGNFFTGLTVNAGANVGEANTAYGNDNFTMLMAGIASKTGYNIELADGKFIIQPNFQMSYSFVNTFDYTNAAGVHINSDPLNAIQLEPGIKFIGNLKNGWQPYAGVSVVWNIMDKTDFLANNVSLPELSIKPYVRYGVGVRKTWGERCCGFFQTYFTNGGRNGVGLQAGFRFTLGKGGTAPVSNKTPQPQKTLIKLSDNN